MPASRRKLLKWMQRSPEASEAWLKAALEAEEARDANTLTGLYNYLISRFGSLGLASEESECSPLAARLCSGSACKRADSASRGATHYWLQLQPCTLAYKLCCRYTPA